MSSAPESFVFGSHSTGGLGEAFQSYRRSQFYFTESVSVPPTDDEYDYDEESAIEEYAELPPTVEQGEQAETGDVNATIGNLVWDEDLTPPGAPVEEVQARRVLLPRPRPAPRRVTDRTIVPTARTPTPREDTPLLHKTTSLTFVEPPVRTDNALPSITLPADGTPAPIARRTSYTSSIRSGGLRRGSTGSRAGKAAQVGKSTFGQTLFNAIAVLLGIGMLSEPLGFAYAGWIGGMLLMIFYGFITCYTAKLLAHFILDDVKLRSYSDIGRKAFGSRAGPLIGTLFCLELFTVSVALVTLFGDSLHSVYPVFTSDTYKFIGLVFIAPTVLVPLSVLSYASVIGIISTLYLIVVMFIDGLSKADSPGSLWKPAATSLNPGNMGELGLAFGLFMAGFSGHAVIPSLARDMVDPSQFDVMIDWAFAITTVIYTTIGVTGYLMFGNSVSGEFSQDLMKISAYNPLLNRTAMWGLVLVPVSKFALATRPLNVTIEIMLGIDTGAQCPDDHGATTKSPALGGPVRPKGHLLSRVLTIVERVVLTLLSVIISILVPEFDSAMAFLGSFSAFLICIIGPLLAKASLVGPLNLWDVGLLFVAIIMATWGTGAAFWSAA